MINKAILVGNLGRDPELKHTKNGTAVCNLSLATEHRVKNGDTWEKATEWHRVTVWGNTAESVAKYCQKGKQIYVEGRIQTRKYEKNGEDRYATEVLAELVKFLGSRGDAAGATSSGSSGAPAPYDPGSHTGGDEIPF